MIATGIRAAWLVLALATPIAALARDREAALAACRAEPDDRLRLACYDRAMDPPGDRAAKAAASAAAPAPAAKPELNAEERFGRRGVMTREEEERKEQEARDLGELTATVTSIETRIDGLMTITLDNGQVWAQNRPDSLFRLKVGDPVRIQPGVLNSFVLSGPSKRSTRVTRLK